MAAKAKAAGGKEPEEEADVAEATEGAAAAPLVKPKLPLKLMAMIAAGVVLVAGLGVFVATNWLLVKGGRPVGPHLALLSQFFLGYRVTFAGSLIGFAWAFGCGFASLAGQALWRMAVRRFYSMRRG